MYASQVDVWLSQDGDRQTTMTHVSLNVNLTAGGTSSFGVHAMVCLPQHGAPLNLISSSDLNQHPLAVGGSLMTAAAQPSWAMHALQHSSLLFADFGQPGGWSLPVTDTVSTRVNTSTINCNHSLGSRYTWLSARRTVRRNGSRCSFQSHSCLPDLQRGLEQCKSQRSYLLRPPIKS